jgi:transcriptional antiterminator RfaH
MAISVTHTDYCLWYVIHTKRGNEHRVEANLLKQGIEVFLPLIEAHQTYHGRMVRVIKPLFPCYLFARLDPKVHYQRVRFTRGVNKILEFSNGVIPISGKVIETIKARMGKNNLVKLEGEAGGDAVEAASSMFKGLSGVFQKEMSENELHLILLNLMGELTSCPDIKMAGEEGNLSINS